MAMARTASEYNTGQTTSLTARCACGLTLLAWGEAKGRGRRALCHGRQRAAHSDACAVAVAQVKQQCAHKIQKVRSPIAHHRPPALLALTLFPICLALRLRVPNQWQEYN
jgi:hypothetical protein